MMSDTCLLMVIECLFSVVYYISYLLFTNALKMLAQKHYVYIYGMNY